MTFPCKDDYIWFEQLSQRQHRIYPDAADYGYLVNQVVKDEARIHLTNLMAVYGSTTTRWGDERSGGSRTLVFVPFEQDDDRLHGAGLDVSFSRDAARHTEFLTIEIRNHSLTPTEANSAYGFKI